MLKYMIESISESKRTQMMSAVVNFETAKPVIYAAVPTRRGFPRNASADRVLTSIH
jgi:hypothetical protein